MLFNPLVLSLDHHMKSDKFFVVLFYAAWIQVSEGNVPVRAVFKTVNGFKHAGAVVAESNCWSMLKGGLPADTSGPAELYFEVIPYWGFKYCPLIIV